MTKIDLRKEKVEKNAAYAKKYEISREDRKQLRKERVVAKRRESEAKYLMSNGQTWEEFIQDLKDVEKRKG